MTIDFPANIVPTPCKTRTFRMVLPKIEGYSGTRHGARIMHGTFNNTPLVMGKTVDGRMLSRWSFPATSYMIRSQTIR